MSLDKKLSMHMKKGIYFYIDIVLDFLFINEMGIILSENMVLLHDRQNVLISFR